MSQQKVFISGVAGFLGSHLADYLLAKGNQVSGCDNFSGGYLENVPAGVEFYEQDVQNIVHDPKVLEGVDVVYHTAALAYDGFSVFCPSVVTESVYSHSVALMSAAIEAGVKRFVFCSSMSRYGEGQHPFHEEQTPNPKTPYGIAKYAAELTLRNLSEVHGMEYVICVPHNIIGPRQKYDDPYRNVASIFINRMLKGQQPIIYGQGQQQRCFSVVYDCLPVLEQLGTSAKASGQTFNIGPDEEPVSVLKLVEIIAEILNFNLDPIFIDNRPGEVEMALCSSNKIRQFFNYKTQYSLRRGLEDMATWISKQGSKDFLYNCPVEISNELLPKTWREAIL